MRMPRRWSPLAALVALAMVLSACGGDDPAVDEPDATEDATEEDAPLALDLDDADDEADDESEEAAEEEVVEDEFDLVAAVTDFTETIPEGWMFIRTMEDFDEARVVPGTMIIDVREEAEVEERGVVPGTTNIPIRSLAQNLDAIPRDRPVIVVCQSGWRAGLATTSLRMLGYDNVLGFRAGAPGWEADGNELVFELEEWESVGVPGDIHPDLLDAVDGFLATLPEGFLTFTGPEEVIEALNAGTPVLDIREPEEYDGGNIDGTISIPIRNLAASEDIPVGTEVIVHCQSGWRAALSMPILHLLGYDNVRGFPGSFDSLVEAGGDI